MTSTSSYSSSSSATHSFDYVIVGAGPSAMGLLLGLLDAAEHQSIGLLSIAIVDHGAFSPHSQPHRIVRDLRHWYRAAHDETSSVTNVYHGTTRSGRVLDVPVGRGRGGTSNVHAGLCLAPTRDDLAAWPAPWDTRLPQALQYVQKTLRRHGCVHDSDTARPRLRDGQGSVVAGDEAINATNVPSLRTILPCLARNNGTHIERCNYYQALVAPLLSRNSSRAPKLHWFDGWQAQRLLFDEKQNIDKSSLRVSGVVCERNGILQILYARREIILCAGAIETPVLLLASGVGQRNDLAAAGIPSTVSEHYRGAVGHNLRDHVLIPRVYVTWPCWKPTLSLNGVEAIWQLAVHQAQFQIVVMDAAVYSDVLPYVVTNVLRGSRAWPVVGCIQSWLLHALRVLLQCVIAYTPMYWLLRSCVTTVGIFHMNPASTGKITVTLARTRSTLTSPPSAEGVQRRNLDIQIELPYLRDPDDVAVARVGWVTCTALVSQLIGGLSLPPHGLVHERWFERFALATCQPYFHWHGTCAIQRNHQETNWVTDWQLRLRDVGGVRICDASIMASPISVPPGLTLAALGYAFAALLLEDRRQVHEFADSQP